MKILSVMCTVCELHGNNNFTFYHKRLWMNFLAYLFKRWPLLKLDKTSLKTRSHELMVSLHVKLTK